jgi:hypothetical protein
VPEQYEFVHNMVGRDPRGLHLAGRRLYGIARAHART